jgi:cytochrome c oxidase subunit 4
MTERPISPAVSVAVCVVLLALTLVTTLLGRVPLGPWNLPVALGIAVVKALLVALYFMHLRLGDSLSRLALAGGVLWLLILFLGAMDDYVTRAWVPFAGK